MTRTGFEITVKHQGVRMPRASNYLQAAIDAALARDGIALDADKIRKERGAGPSELEKEFDLNWMLLCKDLPAPVCEHRPFADRKHRIDRAWPELTVCVEIEGHDHRMTDRYGRDLYKYNRLAADGWTLLRAGRRELFEAHGEFFDMLRGVIEGRRAG